MRIAYARFALVGGNPQSIYTVNWKQGEDVVVSHALPEAEMSE